MVKKNLKLLHVPIPIILIQLVECQMKAGIYCSVWNIGSRNINCTNLKIFKKKNLTVKVCKLQWPLLAPKTVYKPQFEF